MTNNVKIFIFKAESFSWLHADEYLVLTAFCSLVSESCCRTDAAVRNVVCVLVLSK